MTANMSATTYTYIINTCSGNHQTIDLEYFSEHDGEEIEFLIKEDRLLSILSGFRQSAPPTTYIMFERLCRFGHKAFTSGTDFHLQEIVTVAAVNKTWLHASVQATRGHQFLQVHRLIRITADSQLHHKVQDDADRVMDLALGRFKPPPLRPFLNSLMLAALTANPPWRLYDLI